MPTARAASLFEFVAFGSPFVQDAACLAPRPRLRHGLSFPSGTANVPIAACKLVLPSSGRPKGRFAPYAPPLVSSVRPHAVNPYAPPASDVGGRTPPFRVGKAGWLATTATLVHLATIAVGYPEIVDFLRAHPVAVFFVHLGAATSLFLVLGTLLLLARFPSSTLLFAAALATALLEFRNYFVVLPFVSSAAAVLCLSASVRLFLVNGIARRSAGDA